MVPPVQSLNCLEGYFHSPAIKLDDSTTKTEEYHTLVDQLDINSLSSERLMLQYCTDMSKDVTRPEESIGVINVKIATKEQQDGDTSIIIKGEMQGGHSASSQCHKEQFEIGMCNFLSSH